MLCRTFIRVPIVCQTFPLHSCSVVRHLIVSHYQFVRHLLASLILVIRSRRNGSHNKKPPEQSPITSRRGRLSAGQAAGAKRPCQLWMPLRQHPAQPKYVPHTTHKAILHASCVQRQTLKMSDIEPAAKPQLGPLAACNRFAPLAPAKRNV